MSARNTPETKVVLHYRDQWSVFSSSDRYCEHRLYWSLDCERAHKFACAFSAWARRGYPLDATRPLGMNDDGSVYRQGDFDLLVPARADTGVPA
jgi:hypothetical protein